MLFEKDLTEYIESHNFNNLMVKQLSEFALFTSVKIMKIKPMFIHCERHESRITMQNR